ncbi:hypothetical protein JX266_008386 [Neoarthrinium moseri]|nr:hypothetical protein JX266_008386 [Neoarthrinium moseri]
MSTTLYLVIAGAVATAWLGWTLLKSPPKLHIAHVQFEGDNSMARYISETKTLMDQGQAQHLKKGRPFTIRNPSDEKHPLVILPLKYLSEVKSALQSKLSFPTFLDKSNLLTVVGGPTMNFEVTRMVRLRVNRALKDLVEPLQDECLYAWNKVVPACADWTPITLFPILNQLFARIAARVMVGPELCRDDEWLNLALSYTEASIKAIRGVRAKYPPSLRFLAQYLDSNAREVLKIRRRAAQMLGPYLEARRSGRDRSNSHDALQWLLDTYESRKKALSADQLAQDEFILNVASITSSAAVALSIIYDLIDHPDSLQEIKEEISRVFGDFMKESLRLHTLQQLTVQRAALVPWTFKDGFQLPAGTNISFASQQLNLDEDVYPDAQTFDAKRFLRKRENIDPNKFHFASVSDDSIIFGAGFHDCPGRFLAQDVLKLMLIQLLMRYDFKLSGASQSRPPDIAYNFSVMPNIGTQLLMKEKSTQR